MEEKRLQHKGSRSSAGAASIQYRLYFLVGPENRISRSHEFEAESDERAIRIAEGWLEGRAAELWSGPKHLKSWEAD